MSEEVEATAMAAAREQHQMVMVLEEVMVAVAMTVQ